VDINQGFVRHCVIPDDRWCSALRLLRAEKPGVLMVVSAGTIAAGPQLAGSRALGFSLLLHKRLRSLLEVCQSLIHRLQGLVNVFQDDFAPLRPAQKRLRRLDFPGLGLGSGLRRPLTNRDPKADESNA
jgi:hypothetical protein